MNKILLIIAFLLTTQSAHAATLTKAPNNLGLVGYWSFNDCRGLKASDFSGYNNTGTLTNGPTWGAGRLGCALQFDGTDDYIELDQSVGSVEGWDTGTLSVWFKTSADGGVISMSKSTDNSNFLDIFVGNFTGFYADESITFYIRRAGVVLLVMHVRNGTSTYKDNQWHHVLVKTGDGANAIYVDGVSQSVTFHTGSLSTNEFSNLDSMNAVTFGARRISGSVSDFFSGSIDDVRVYTRALGATEVARLYTLGEAKIRSSSSEAGSGLLAHWKLDDRAGAVAVDSSGRGTSGTLSGFSFTGTTSNWIAGYRGGALNFDGVDDYISFSPTTPTTVAFWQKTTGDAFIFGNGTISNRQIRVGQSGQNVMSIYDGTNNPKSDTLSVARGQWSHLVYVFTGGSVFFYENGIAKGSGTGNPIDLRTLGSRTGTQEYISGTLDDVRLYNTALSADEVRLLYSVGSSRPPLMNVASNRLTAGTSLASGLVGHWTFDGRYLNTTTASDTSGQGLHGTLTNGPTPVIGKMGQALSFDGSNDYINAGRPAFFDESPTKLTLSAWIKPTSISGYQAILGSFTGSIPYYFFGMGAFYGSPNALNIQFRNNSAVMNVSAVAPSIETGKWSHVTVVWDGSQPRLTFYVDGAQISTTTTSLLTSMDPLAAPRLLGIGGDGGGAATSVFPGSIDDVRIYTRALTSAEVAQLYNLGK